MTVARSFCSQIPRNGGHGMPCRATQEAPGWVKRQRKQVEKVGKSLYYGVIGKGKACMCVSSVASVVFDSLWPYGLYSLPGSSVHGILQARIFEWLLCPPPGDLPDPGIEPVSLKSPVLAGRFFTTSTTWEASKVRQDRVNKQDWLKWSGVA